MVEVEKMMGEVNNMEAKKFDLNDIVEMKKQQIGRAHV